MAIYTIEWRFISDVHAIIITCIFFQSSINIHKFLNAIFNNPLRIDILIIFTIGA